MECYFFILAFIVFLAISNTIAKRKFYAPFYFMGVFFLFVFMAFRDVSIGTDLKTYLPLFEKLKSSSLIDFIGINSEFIGYEKGYLLLNYIISFFGDSRLLLVIISGIYIYSVSHLISKFSPLPFLSLLLFVLANFYFSGMNLLRQYLAIAVLLFSLRYVINRSFIRFIIIVLIASSIHRTALVFTLIYFLYPIQLTRRYVVFVVSISLLSYFVLGQFLFSYLLSLMELSKFEKYILAGANGGMIFYLFILCFASLMIFIPFDKRNESTNRTFFHMMLLALLVQSFAVTIAELARLTQYFFISFIVYLPCLVSCCKRAGVRLVLIVSFTILMLGYFIITAQNNTDSVIPYKFML